MSIMAKARSNWLKSQDSSVMGLEELTLVTEEREYEPGYSNPGTEHSSLMSKWYNRGVEAGKIDTWMDVENTIKETAEKHPEIKDVNDLVQTDIDGWEETDHFRIKYGSEMEKDARTNTELDIDLYSEIKSEFWVGYLRGRQEIGKDILGIANELVRGKTSSPSNPGEPLHEPTPGFSNFHSLMLHAVAEMYGPGGIVVDEAKARATPCSCVEYKPGKYWCTSKGIVGALTDEQENIYCNPREIVERPAIKERMARWQECVDRSREAMPPVDGQTRLEIYLNSMSKCLTEAGIEA